MTGMWLNPIVSGGSHLTGRQLLYVKFPGELFLRMLKLLIVPLVVASNISAIASLNARTARTLTLLSLVYYVLTTVAAVVLGLFLVNVLEPGSRHRNATLDSTGAKLAQNYSVTDSMLDLMRNMIPDNLFLATFRKSVTITTTKTLRKNDDTTVKYQNEDNSADDNISSINSTSLFGQMEGENEEINTNVNVEGTNVLGLITFSILFGFAVHSLGPDAAVLADMFHAIRRVIVYLVSILIWFSPIGIMSLIAHELASTEDLGSSLHKLSLYAATVMSGLVIHGFIVLPLLLYAVTKRNPLKYAYNMLQALMCALGTASSTATLPCTIRCLESGNRIDQRVTRFMLPLGTTINMDGTALFQCVACVYISQLTGIPLSAGDVILIGLTSILASMAATSMPSAGMITIIMVLTSVGLPANKLAFLYPVDWFLDRFRTMINVFSDSVGVAIVSHLCEDKLLDDLTAATPNINQYAGGLTEVDLQSQDREYEKALGRRPSKLSPIIPMQANYYINRYCSPTLIDRVSRLGNGRTNKFRTKINNNNNNNSPLIDSPQPKISSQILKANADRSPLIFQNNYNSNDYYNNNNNENNIFPLQSLVHPNNGGNSKRRHSTDNGENIQEEYINDAVYLEF